MISATKPWQRRLTTVMMVTGLLVVMLAGLAGCARRDVSTLNKILKNFYQMSKHLLKFWKSLFILPIKTYQLIVSPMLPNTCRHLPTCSDYTIEAINTYGVFKGILKGSARILRCNPFGSSGYDPIKK